MKPRVVDPTLWSDMPKKIAVDLSAVRDFDGFTRVMEVEFPLEEDAREIWVAIRHWLFWQTSPLEVRFDGWSAFEKKMPRYAKKLKDIFRTHVGRVRVEYHDESAKAPDE